MQRVWDSPSRTSISRRSVRSEHSPPDLLSVFLVDPSRAKPKVRETKDSMNSHFFVENTIVYTISKDNYNSTISIDNYKEYTHIWAIIHYSRLSVQCDWCQCCASFHHEQAQVVNSRSTKNYIVTRLKLTLVHNILWEHHIKDYGVCSSQGY